MTPPDAWQYSRPVDSADRANSADVVFTQTHEDFIFFPERLTNLAIFPEIPDNICFIYLLQYINLPACVTLGRTILSVNWRHIRLIDLVSAKGKQKSADWMISFHSLIRQCFNIQIRHCNPLRIRNIKIEWSKQLHHNNTLPLFSPLPKLGQWCDFSWPRECITIAALCSFTEWFTCLLTWIKFMCPLAVLLLLWVMPL